MNRERMAQVRDRIASLGAEHCHMGEWAIGKVTGEGELACRTVACIGGHTIAVTEGTFRIVDYRVGVLAIEYRARTALGLQTVGLFYANQWPIRHQRLRVDEGDQKAMVQLLDDMLDGVVVESNWGLHEVDDETPTE